MADIQVANTDADLSGNTVVTEENAYTITGLHTFSRSTNAPFACISGAAYVQYLDADKLDGQEGTYYLAAANITGTTLASNVVTSSLTAVGTIATGVWNGTAVTVPYGGTGATSLTDGGVLLGSGTGAITATAVLGDGVILIGDASGDPTTLDVGSSTAITILGTVATGVWNGTAVTVAYGGTGASSLTDGGILLGSGTGAITALGVASNGQIPIGDGSGDPQLATITGTSNEISVANGAGSITIGMPDDITIGTSLAVGASAVAAGDNSLAAGYEASAAGDNAMALGYSSSASADHSFAIGYDMTASASHALGLGYQGTVSASHSVLMTLSSTSRTLSTGAVFSVMDGSVGINTLTPGTELDVDGDLTVRGTGASALDVGGGINVGTGNVALVGTDGKINGPLSSTIIDDLSGANLTTLNASNISSGTLANARLPTNVDLGGTLDVTGATTLDSTLGVVGDVVFNDAGADKDFRVETSGNANMMVVDGALNGISFGIAPSDYWRYAFAGAFTSGGASTSCYGFWHASALTGHSGDSSGIVGMRLDTSAVTAGNATLIAQLSVNEPQITTSHTVTNSASVYIQGVASEATNNYALWVDSGLTALDGGVTFNSSETTAANTLDDYEEGTFTPVLTGTSSASGVGYDQQSGIYTKVGDMVFVNIYLDLSSKGTIVGFLKITGLPFTNASHASPLAVSMQQVIQGADYRGTGPVYGSSAFMYLFKQKQSAATSDSQMDSDDINDSTIMAFSGSYKV